MAGWQRWGRGRVWLAVAWLAAPGVAGAAALPAITELQLEGEQWTCLADGRPLRGVLFRPEGPGPHGGIVVSHGLGGSAVAMAQARGREFARWGLLAIATDYTHARDATGRVDRTDASQFGASAENVWRARACLAILQQQPDVDPHRLAAFGHSMGAFVTIALAASAGEHLAAAIITAGGIKTSDGTAGPAPGPRLAAQVGTPFIIFHGDQDRTVPAASSERFERVLRERATDHERHLIEGLGHSYPPELMDRLYPLMRNWLERYGVVTAVEQEAGE